MPNLEICKELLQCNKYYNKTIQTYLREIVFYLPFFGSSQIILYFDSTQTKPDEIKANPAIN